MNRTVRTFVAVEVSPEVRAKAKQLIATLSAAATGIKVKWSDPQDLHLTMKFLGDVDMLDVPGVCAAVEAAVKDLPPFDFQVQGAGAFPDAQRPRTVWLGVREGSEELGILHDCLEQALSPLGFRREQRRFRPHLTLGRVRSVPPEGAVDLAAMLAEHRDYFAGASDVSEVVVFSSELDRAGPKYEVLSTTELKG